MVQVIAPNSGIIITQEDVDLVKMYAKGGRAADIGDSWGKSSRTIEQRLDKLRGKTGTKTAAELVSFFYIHKLLKID